MKGPFATRPSAVFRIAGVLASALLAVCAAAKEATASRASGQAELFPRTLILWRLENDTPVYATNALPCANGIASLPVDTLPVGTSVRVLGRIPPLFLLILCSTPDGEPRDVAAFASDFPANILPKTRDFP